MSNNNVLNSNGKIIRIGGNIYKVIVAKLGSLVLADAECVYGQNKGELINLKKSRSALASDLRSAIDMQLVS